MNIVPPSFKFNGDIEKSKSLKSIGYKLYNYSISLAKLENIKYKTITKKFDDGSTIISTVLKNSVYDNWSGTVQIYTSSEQGNQFFEDELTLSYYDITSEPNFENIYTYFRLFSDGYPVPTNSPELVVNVLKNKSLFSKSYIITFRK